MLIFHVLVTIDFPRVNMQVVKKLRKEFAKVKKLLSPPKGMPSDLAAKVIGEIVP
jgi:hypothetical protein